jgi:hypothetical protein
MDKLDLMRAVRLFERLSSVALPDDTVSRLDKKKSARLRHTVPQPARQRERESYDHVAQRLACEVIALQNRVFRWLVAVAVAVKTRNTY